MLVSCSEVRANSVTTEWIPFIYREFWDVPRALVVQWDERTLFFDCLLDLETEEYPGFCSVYELPSELVPMLPTMSWTDLRHHGECVGSLGVGDLEFDESKRSLVSRQSLEKVTPCD